MNAFNFLAAATLLCCGQVRAADAKSPGRDLVLFDFEDASALTRWRALADQKLPPEPAPKFELSNDHATSGAHSLKITFAGGAWPTITTTNIPADWAAWHTFRADVTVSRPCLVGFCVMQEQSRRGGDWDGAVSRWVRTVLAQPGRNEISAPLHPNDYSAISPKLGRVVSLEIFMMNPRPGESIHVDHVRLLTQKEPPPIVQTQFKVLGTDLVVSGVRELEQKLRPQWKPPVVKSLDEVEAEFRAKFAELKKSNPRAVLATFRDGEAGFDPRDLPRVFDGWRDAYWSSHGPDAMTVERARNFGRTATQEIFMRHRAPLMRVDLAGIPAGSEILAAQLVVIRQNTNYDKGRNPLTNSCVWVAEPCNRPWVEAEVNAYEFARDKFWRAYGGTHWGADPDFLPLYLAHGAGTGPVQTLDFTEAVRFWTDGRQANHGFMLHCDEHDWMGRAWYREAKEVRNRPALLVIYVPKDG